jgi:hypothetical protein
VSVFTLDASESESGQNRCDGPVGELQLLIQPFVEHLMLLLNG